TNLAQCSMSIHLLGRKYGLVPEGGSASLVEIQNELAVERGREDRFSRLLWIPSGIEVTDARQRAVLDRVRTDPRIDDRSDVLETYLEDFRTALQERLGRVRKDAESASSAAGPVFRPAGVKVPTVYLIYDQRDAAVASAWADRLFEQRVEVLHPLFD